MSSRKYNIAVAGATGAVGEKILRTLEDRKFPVGNIRLLASSRSEGKEMLFKGKAVKVQVLTPESFEEIDLALFSAGASISREFAEHAVRSGAVVIDNSSAFRNIDSIPLVIPEINPDDAKKHKGIISNPNCTTAIMLTVLYPLYKFSPVKKIIVSSYQSVSGAGQHGIDELKGQIKAIYEEKSLTVSKFPHRIAYNVIPHIDTFTENGYTKEEMKMYYETRKILHDDRIKVSATCVRVPVISVHSMAVTAVFEKQVTVEKARELLSAAEGVMLTDDISSGLYPMPVNSTGRPECFAGRIRKDTAFKNALTMWICGDQLLKGAALNAVQIAELLIK
jgi:aspartate-semialdehyde dehydrogenase